MDNFSNLFSDSLETLCLFYQSDMFYKLDLKGHSFKNLQLIYLNKLKKTIHMDSKLCNVICDILVMFTSSNYNIQIDQIIIEFENILEFNVKKDDFNIENINKLVEYCVILQKKGNFRGCVTVNTNQFIDDKLIILMDKLMVNKRINFHFKDIGCRYIFNGHHWLGKRKYEVLLMFHKQYKYSFKLFFNFMNKNNNYLSKCWQINKLKKWRRNQVTWIDEPADDRSYKPSTDTSKSLIRVLYEDIDNVEKNMSIFGP